jgi:hypothetical protein
MSNRLIAETETMRAGERRQIVLTLLDKLHRDGAINYEKWVAGNTLRDQIMKEMPPSEGVSSYGSNVKAAEPSRKADRVGRRLTGFEVQPDGELRYPGGRKSRSNERRLEDALHAAIGLYTDEGRKVANVKHAEILMRIVLHSENMPTLTGLTLELTDRYGAKSKQAPPFSLGVIDTWLGRLAQHYGLSK